MNIWESTVLTDKGAALQAKLIEGQTLHITQVMTGGAKVPLVNLRQQTSVTDGGKRITLQPVRIEGHQMVVPVLLENTGLEESYDLWQVGIYAQDPDEGEILYCLAQATEAKHIPSAAEGPGFSITWDFYFKTSNTVPIEVNLNSKGLVSIEQYQVHEGEIESLKKSNIIFEKSINTLSEDLDSTNLNLVLAQTAISDNKANISNKANKSVLFDLVVMRKISYVYNCSPNSSVSFTINFPDVSGYTFVSGYCCSTNSPVCFCYYFEGTKSSICYLKNYHSSTSVSNRYAEFIGLYIKNTF